MMATMDIPFRSLAERSLLPLAVLGLIFAVSYIYPRIRIKIKTRNIPLMGKELGGYYKRRNEFLRDPMKFYFDGYKRAKDKPFRVTHYEGMNVKKIKKKKSLLWNQQLTLFFRRAHCFASYGSG